MEITFDKDLTISIPKKIDLERLIALNHTNKDRLSEFLFIETGWESIKGSRLILHKMINNFHDNISLHLCIRFRNEVIGMIHVKNLYPKDRTTFMSYWISSQFVGRGLMIKALQSTLSQIGTLGIDRVQLAIHPHNIPSVALAEVSDFLKFPNVGGFPISIN